MTVAEVLADVLPSAVGVALSPVPIIATVVMLGSTGGRRRGAVFAVGWVVGLTLATTVVVLASSGAVSDDAPAAWVAWLRVAVGLGFLALAVRTWRSRPADGAAAELPGWMAKLDEMSAARTALLGSALAAVNPKNLALSVAAAAVIADGALDGGPTALAVAVFVVVGSLTVAGPVVLAAIAPQRSATTLASVQTFMSAHNAAIMTTVLLLLGVKLAAAGLAAV